jgi:hypothetical protein
MADLPNLPPADELFALRAEIRQLTERENALKTLMISDPSARTGNSYCVEIKEVTTSRTDLKELKAMHPDIVDAFTFPLKTLRVELRAISEDGEITPIKRYRNEDL